MPKTSRLTAYKDPKSPIAEIYRTLRTNIKFASFEKDIKTIVFTSAGPNEGKSTVISNLAVTLCQTGSRVLLVEGDLRNPTAHKMIGLPNSFGLTNILVNNGSYKDFVQHSMLEGLDVITSGPKPPNPSEILGSGRMKNLLGEFKKDYDYVLIDAPPVVIVTDAALLASVCDGVILVVGSGEAIIEGAVKAKELLVNVKANLIGTVLNKCKESRIGNYYYSHYYYGEKSQKKKRIL
jgi:capsular exopolysaccharide synthesis family protein